RHGTEEPEPARSGVPRGDARHRHSRCRAVRYHQALAGAGRLVSRPSGQGTVYKEAVPGRKTRWRAEKIVRLPDGSRKRIIVRGRTQGEALANLAAKERALENAHPDAEKLTARAFLKRWLEHQRGRVKPSTLA